MTPEQIDQYLKTDKAEQQDLRNAIAGLKNLRDKISYDHQGYQNSIDRRIARLSDSLDALEDGIKYLEELKARG